MEQRQPRRQKLTWDLKEDGITFGLIVLVGLIQSVAMNGFYVPHGFLSGGVTGVAMLINYLTGLPTWPFIILLNIPICIIGWHYLKPKMVIFSGTATAVLSAAYALTDGIDFGVKDPIISAIAGAAIIGISGSLILRRNATMGGNDVISAVLSKRFTIPVGTFNILFNVVIMSFLAVFRGLELALTSMLAMFVCNVAFNYAFKGLNRTNTVFIISDKWNEIAPHVLNDLHRGVTYIDAEGAYTGKPKKLVYCILRTSELSKIKRYVREADPNAMISIIDTQEVLGRGFGSFN